MKVATLRVDDKGRLQLPKSFCIANGIGKKCPVYLETINGSKFAVRLTFCNHDWRQRHKVSDNE